MKAIKKPPRHASTCSGMLYLSAILDKSSMGSITPTGKLGAEPAILKAKFSFKLRAAEFGANITCLPCKCSYWCRIPELLDWLWRWLDRLARGELLFWKSGPPYRKQREQWLEWPWNRLTLALSFENLQLWGSSWCLHFGSLDSLGTSQISVGLASQHDGFSATRGHLEHTKTLSHSIDAGFGIRKQSYGSASVVIAIEHAADHSHYFSLHLAHIWENVSMHRIGPSELLKHFGVQFGQAVISTINTSRHSTALPAELVHLQVLVQFAQDLVERKSVIRQLLKIQVSLVRLDDVLFETDLSLAQLLHDLGVQERQLLGQLKHDALQVGDEV